MSELLHNRFLNKIDHWCRRAGFSSRAVGFSLLVHFLIVVVAIIANSNNRIYKPFMVRGLYSRSLLPVKWTLPHAKGARGGSLKAGKGSGATKKSVVKKEVSKPLSKKKKTVAKSVASTKNKKITPPAKGTHLSDEKVSSGAKKKSKKNKKNKVSEKPLPEPKKEVVKQEVPKEPEKVKEQEIVKEPIKESEVVNEPEVAQEASVDDATVVERASDQMLNNDGDEVSSYDFTGHVDHQMMMLQMEIQEEIERVWQPPVGVPQGTTVKARLTIDSAGAIADVEIIESSPIQIYDMSVMRDAHRFSFSHKGLWGKTIDVTFRQ